MKRYGTIAAVLVVLSLMLAACGGAKETASGTGKTGEVAQAAAKTDDKPKQLKMGLIPAEDSAKQIEQFDGLKAYLEKEMNAKIDMFVASDYAGVVEAMRSKKIDLAWFGPFSFLLAEREVGAEPIVVENRPGSGTGYHSLIVTRKETGINKIEDLKGKTYAFVDPGSTSGFLIPSANFKKLNIEPDKFFKEVKYAGGHDAVGLAVANKQVDAGSMDDITFNKMVKDGLIKKDDIHIIWTSDLIPGSPIAVRPDLDTATKDALKKALLAVGDKSPQSLEKLGVIKYEETNKEFYNAVRDAAKTLNIDLAKKK